MLNVSIFSCYRMLPEWSKKQWTKSLVHPGMQWLGKALDLNWHMKWRTCCICSLVEIWQFVFGNVHRSSVKYAWIEEFSYMMYNNNFIWANGKNMSTVIYWLIFVMFILTSEFTDFTLLWVYKKIIIPVDHKCLSYNEVLF